MTEKSPLNSLPKHNLFGIDEQDYDSARVIVLPIPYDATTTYKTGSREGPDAIINASRNMELYSCELGRDVSSMGIYTMQSMSPDVSSPENMIDGISKEVSIILQDGKIPLILGGEHTVTLGALKAFKAQDKDISIIHFDAHADTRPELLGSKYMHATVMARAKELYKNIVHVGIRSIDADTAKNGERNAMLFMEDMRSMDFDDVISFITNAAPGNVYVTVDLDVLDPSEMPSVGTPEPDGLRFYELMKIIKGIAERKKLAGLDITELCPIPYLHAPDYLAAKLAYLTLGHFMFSKGTV
ncbi:N(1)-aminopropylagmatine ureohydrolase [uncultured archaeon]|nr:N(1)-aminopropylagmatine ureohydrolase [uncultured archaeon]